MTTETQPPSFTIPPTAPSESRGPAWPLWMVCAVGVFTGAVILVSALVPSVAEAPVLTAAAVLAFGSFAALCFWLLGKINYFRSAAPETSALAFLWGGFAATGYALLANTAVREHLIAQNRGGSWSLFAPLTEEPAKDLGIVIVLLLASTRPRTALDGLVAGSFVGLGFEIAESIARALNNAIASYPPGQRDNLGSLAVDVTHEVLRNSWTGHIVLTGIAGFGIGYLLTTPNRPAIDRWAVALGLVALAAAGHLLWNTHRFGVFYVLGQFGLLAVYLWLIRVGRNREGELYTPYLEYAPDVVAPAQIAAMRSDAARRAERRAAGRPRQAARERQRALAQLAAGIANGDAQRAHEAVAALSDAPEFRSTRVV
ncbi:MAG: PrsW family intramembrane metalloprotease [Mycobacterium sp.]|nr:PrsW family intramembrane metalloprotease [Mycobacterium sp.]